jgi:hypothetical protein
MSRKPPPRKRPGVPTGRRTLNGVIMDVPSVAAYRGETEKSIRAKVARKLVPFRKQGGRVIFIKSEIDEFHRRLPGVTLEEALRNAAARNGAGEA